MRQRSYGLTALAAASLTAALALGGCAPAATDAGNGGSGGAKATGGSGSGSGGSGSGSGGSTGTGGTPSTGTGGTPSTGTGGSASGTGGSGSGTGGSASGTGGSASGTGGSASGTGGSGSPDAGGTPDTASATPTFTALYTEVFGSMTCNTAACHGVPKGGIDMSDKMKAWTTLTAGNHEMELLSRIKSTNAAMRMPKGKDPLPAATIKKIEDWVTAGAKND